MKILIIGIGLMGSSFAMHIKKHQPDIEIHGYDNNPEEIKHAHTLGVYNWLFGKIDKLEYYDFAFIATPIKPAISLAHKISSKLPETIISDMCSVKTQICSELKNNSNFVGGHPMTGSERKGAISAETEMFDNCLYILSYYIEQQKSAEKLCSFLKNLNIRVIQMPPEEHDKAVALASHLPYYTALTLTNVFTDFKKYYEVAGTGFRDTTRVASSPLDMWEEITEFNRQNILNALTNFKSELEKTIKNIEEKTEKKSIENAIKTRKDVLNQKLYSNAQKSLEINLPDEPGALVKILSKLENINIKNIVIEDCREGRTGAVTLFFKNNQEYLKAREILEER